MTIPDEQASNTRKVGLSPVVDSETEILILGSLPSDESLARQQYYARPSNDFWKLIGAVLHESLAPAEYPIKIQTLLKHKIGLWDV